MLCRCLYEIGATPSSKLQLLTNGFNESGSLVVLPRTDSVHADTCRVVMVPDISQHVWLVDAETGESLSALMPFPSGGFPIVSCLL
jgi:hypothetical protein